MHYSPYAYDPVMYPGQYDTQSQYLASLRKVEGTARNGGADSMTAAPVPSAVCVECKRRDADVINELRRRNEMLTIMIVVIVLYAVLQRGALFPAVAPVYAPAAPPSA